MRIGLCGSHRTGKTTLAEALSSKSGLRFIKTTTSEIFRASGLDPAEPMDFDTRLKIQYAVLGAAEKIWRSEKDHFITDRTPVDMMAYTLADIQGATEADFGGLEEYLNRCFEITNKFFNALVVVQPGIPLVYEEGKAALNRAYIEHMNYLVIGLCNDQRIKCNVLCISHDITSIEGRVKTVIDGLNLTLL